MENLNILLLGAGNRLSLCEWLIEAGKKYNKKVNLYSVEVKNPVPISQHATILKGEKWDSPNFEKSIIDIVKTYNIHMLLPLMDAGCTALSKYKENIEKETNTWAVVSSYNICNTMEDKGLSEKWFIKNKVNIPYDIKFPKIFKSIKGYGSRDQFIVKDQIELSLISEYKDLSNYIDQPFIEGPEYTIDAYVSKTGKLIGAVSRLRLEVINGEVSRGLTKREPELLKEVERVLNLPGFLGPITLQFIKCNSDSKFYMIECNPRLGGGSIQSFKAGANYCECLVAEYLNLELPDCSKWEENLLMMRCNREIWSHGNNN
jgi:carbamoyl-phosphate synthase large subunit